MWTTFRGGLETLFGNARSIKIKLETIGGHGSTIADLVKHLCLNLMTDKRTDLFVIDDFQVRPGVLVLINDADWELEGQETYKVKPGDDILFASTLHGG
ncbi:ubiquitin-related modifier 1 [Lipomyces japonicus]|uniref:ubiquitin-related modifier 1 n=1 Tax=Lipomyces japonicus TaxID=56871 RepID=UPI0034CF30C9